MREVTGDIWDFDCDARVIPTNGSVNRHGAAVMGRGVALQCKERYPGIETALGVLLRGVSPTKLHCIQWVPESYGNVVQPDVLVFFPVKFEWRQKANLSLIIKSSAELLWEAQMEGWNTVALPRVGCGNGGLSWDDVGPILRSIFDDRFVVVNLP